jgi:hypothetical protein
MAATAADAIKVEVHGRCRAVRHKQAADNAGASQVAYIGADAISGTQPISAAIAERQKRLLSRMDRTSFAKTVLALVPLKSPFMAALIQIKVA